MPQSQSQDAMKAEQIFADTDLAQSLRKIEVFHLRDDVTWSQRDKLCGDTDAVQAAYSNCGYRHVATCSATSACDPIAALEEAFRLTNNIDTTWVLSPYVVVTPPVRQEGGCRSTSIGDLMWMDGVMYLVRSAGFAGIEGFAH